MRYCEAHSYVRDDETTLGDPYADRDAAAEDCPDCLRLTDCAHERATAEVVDTVDVRGTETHSFYATCDDCGAEVRLTEPDEDGHVEWEAVE